MTTVWTLPEVREERLDRRAARGDGTSEEVSEPVRPVQARRVRGDGAGERRGPRRQRSRTRAARQRATFDVLVVDPVHASTGGCESQRDPGQHGGGLTAATADRTSEQVPGGTDRVGQ